MMTIIGLGAGLSTASLNHNYERELMVFTLNCQDHPLSEALLRTQRCMATLAHELRDPLSAIMLSLDELQSICTSEPSAKSTQQIAMDSALHMATVIEDVLDLYQSHDRKLGARTDEAELTRIVMSAVKSSHLQMAKRSHRLSVSLPSENLMIKSHPSRLQQILTNLLVNAAKYTEPGGAIALNIEYAADMLVVRVTDNGVGMTPDFISTIFMQHNMQPSLRPHDAQGLGIGLALVKSLVELQGGTVNVHSDGPGKGSEFEVRLPGCVAVKNPPSNVPRLAMEPSTAFSFVS